MRCPQYSPHILVAQCEYVRYTASVCQLTHARYMEDNNMTPQAPEENTGAAMPQEGTAPEAPTAPAEGGDMAQPMEGGEAAA